PFAGYRRRIDDPVLFAGTALREALAAAGVDVASREIRRGAAPESAVEIARHVSEPLGAWLRHLGKESSNFHAEQLLRILGAEGKGAPGAAEAGAEVVLEALAEMGVDTARISIRNGSGLYDGGRAGARAVAAVLAAAYADPRIRPEFLAHLSIVGVDGTAGTRMPGSPARGLVRAKTGTLAGTFALSGYVLAPQGHGGYAFSTIVNNAAGQATAARNLQDSIVRALADCTSR
ncbi:MAG: D-alanyl-D-alanine carboxypeptidase/D-alanyl-D-alanine-endopeptidase, partial [Myxococcota bacterium]|nr:D-alanyl-D-alanine carboxypeptidase/D-alanyl-D-alanine-endopeptidase [Myxococcota bacterium]